MDRELFCKVENAIMILKQYEPPEGYYVAFSGGKDSIVILDLVRRSGVKHDVHFNITSVDPPELIAFINSTLHLKSKNARSKRSQPTISSLCSRSRQGGRNE